MPDHRFASKTLAPLGLVLLALASHVAPARADADHGLILSLETYVDDATDRSETSVASLVNEDEEAEVGRGMVSGSIALTYLAPIGSTLRLGAGARYLSNYRFELDDAEEDDDPTLIGRLVEVYGRGELNIPLAKQLQLVPAIELGIPLLFPSGQLQTQLDSLEDQGYSISSLPRSGFFGGIEIGARYALLDWLALRSGLGVLYERIFLYDASTDDRVAEASRTLSLIRFRLAVGAEATF